MALIDDIKTALRISNTAYDTEIQDLIDTCKADLQLCGLLVVDETDPLIKRAITVYVKANFGWDNPDSEKLQQSYEMLKKHLSMSTDYAYYKVTINAGKQCEVTFDGETKQTDNNGTVVFYSRAKNHVEYSVDGTTYYIDITGDVTINVV